MDIQMNTVEGRLSIEDGCIISTTDIGSHWMVEKFTEEQALKLASGLIEMVGRLRMQREQKTEETVDTVKECG